MNKSIVYVVSVLIVVFFVVIVYLLWPRTALWFKG